MSYCIDKRVTIFVTDKLPTRMTAETFSGLWFIHEPFALRMQSIVLPRLAAGKDPIPGHFKLRTQISAIDENGNLDINRYYLRDALRQGGGDVAVIEIEGTMSRYGYCGYGNERIVGILKAAEAEPQVKAVVLKMDTPGGTVDSTDILADAVARFSKPIIAWTNFCASAGYFVASQADQIVMENSIASEVGSIGVLMVYVDQSEALEKEGLKVTIYRADASVDKARINGLEPLTNELEAEIRASLNEASRAFNGYVRRGRAGKLKGDAVLTGKMYNKRQALKEGLVDKLGSLDDAIAMARKLAALDTGA